MSKQKLNHLKKLEKELEIARDKVQNYKQKISEEGCFHPDDYIDISYEEHDNGYGRFSYIRYKICMVCGAYLDTTYGITKEEVVDGHKKKDLC